MMTPAFGLTATERVLPMLALDFTTATLDPRVTFTRTTNATNPATYIDSSGAITAATNNQPRFDYDPITLVCKGLLIEESRTNSLLNTDLLSTQIVTVTAAARTLSFYGTGSVTLSGTHTAVVSGTGAYPTRTTYTFTPTAGALTLTVSGTVQYAQLEAGAFATSYIPTTTAALTRNADVATMTGTNLTDWYTPSAGTFFAEVQIDGYTSAGWTGLVRYNSSSDLTGFARSGASWYGYTYQGANIPSGRNFDSSSGYAIGTIAKLAHSFKVGETSVLSVNGDTPTVGTLTGASNDTSTQFYLGRNGYNGRQYFRKLSFYTQKLTNAEVQAISKL